jgi:hypothetical protein
VTSDESEDFLRVLIMSQSAVAPEKMRMNVKLAASMLVCFSANRQSRELPAKAIIATSVRMKSRVGFTALISRTAMEFQVIAENAQRRKLSPATGGRQR